VTQSHLLGIRAWKVQEAKEKISANHKNRLYREEAWKKKGRGREEGQTWGEVNYLKYSPVQQGNRKK